MSLEALHMHTAKADAHHRGSFRFPPRPGTSPAKKLPLEFIPDITLSKERVATSVEFC